MTFNGGSGRLVYNGVILLADDPSCQSLPSLVRVLLPSSVRIPVLCLDIPSLPPSPLFFCSNIMLAGDYDVCRNKQENAEGNLCSGFTHEKKLRLLLLLSVNMLHGLEDRSWHHCPPPKRCGFQNRNIMNLVPELFTTSVFKSTIGRSIVVLIDILKVH